MNVLKILYPDRCPLCDTARSLKETGICPECEKKLIVIKEPVCIVCGRPLSKENSVCPDCKISPRYFDGGKSVFAYSSLNDSIYKFKYMNRAAYAKCYGKLMVKEVGEWLSWIKPDALVPVPLHKKRLIARGYNQATELAEEISRLTGIPVRESLAGRRKNTVPQKLMDKRGRQINMKRAFIVREDVVKLRRVVVIDDIFTTGSTINSLAKELKEAGIKEVWFLTVSRAGL